MSNQQQMLSRGRLIAVAVAATCAFGAASLAAADGAKAAAAPKSQRVVVNQVRVNDDGLKVFIDPATGKVRQPTPGEVQALDQALASLGDKSLKNIRATQYADGTVSIALNGAFMNSAVVRVNPNGTVSQACTDDAAAAAAFMNGGAPAAEEQ